MAEVKAEKSASSTATTARRTRRLQPRDNANKQPVLRLEGACPELKGFTFDCANDRHIDSFNLSMKDVAFYVGLTFTYGGDLNWTIEHTKKFVVPEPDDIDAKTISATDKNIWEKRVDEYVKRDVILEENCERL
jgi:hypothetical protein